MRTPLIAGNFKMFKTVAETVAYVNDLRALIEGHVRGVDIVDRPAVHGARRGSEGRRRQRDRRRRTEHALGA